MGEEQMEVEETTLPEENQEVDASIQLCHKIFALSNPSQGTDVSALGDEVKQIVLDRGASRDAANPSRAMRRFHARHAPDDPARTKSPSRGSLNVISIIGVFVSDLTLDAPQTS
jgi:hypothetical protein